MKECCRLRYQICVGTTIMNENMEEEDADVVMEEIAESLRRGWCLRCRCQVDDETRLSARALR